MIRRNRRSYMNDSLDLDNAFLEEDRPRIMTAINARNPRPYRLNQINQNIDNDNLPIFARNRQRVRDLINIEQNAGVFFLDNQPFYTVLKGEKSFNIINLIISIVFSMLSLFYLLLTRNYLSIIMISFSSVTIICSIIQLLFHKSSYKKTDYYVTFLYINEIIVWNSLIGALFLLVIGDGFLAPLYSAASDKNTWAQSSFSIFSLPYQTYHWIMILLLTLLIITLLSLSIIKIIIYHFFEGISGELFERVMNTVMIIEIFYSLCSLFLIKYDTIFLSFFFLLSIIQHMFFTLLFGMIFLFYSLFKNRVVFVRRFLKIMLATWISIVFFHIVISILILCNKTEYYSSTISSFSYHYSEKSLQSSINEEKYYFTGNEEDMTACIKSLIVFHWETPKTPYGCLNLASYYKGRIILNGLLNVVILAPLFEIVILIFIISIIKYTSIDYLIRRQPKYKKCQSLFRFIFNTTIFVTCLISGFCIVFCIKSHDRSADYVNSYYYETTVNYDHLLKQIIPSNGYHNYDNGEEREYFVHGRFIDKDIPELMVILTPRNPRQGVINQKVKTNEYFTLGKIMSHIVYTPDEYLFTVTTPKNETIDFGIILVGGLTSWKYIELNDISLPLLTFPPITGRVNLSIVDIKDYTKPITQVELFFFQGRYQPTTSEEITSYTNYKPDNFINYHLITEPNETIEIPKGYYTMVVYKKGYYIESYTITISHQNQEIFIDLIYLKEINKSNSITIALEWKSQTDMNLYGLIEDYSTCLIGYMNKKCFGAKHLSSEFDYSSIHNKVELIHLETFNDYSYLFYIHNYKSNSKSFQNEHFVTGFEIDTDEPVISSDVFNAKIKLYLPGYKFPLFNVVISNELMGSDNKWVLFEMHESKGDLIFRDSDKNGFIDDDT